MDPLMLRLQQVIGIGQPPRNDGDDRPLLVPLVSDGVVVGREPLETARERHRSAMAELPAEAHKLSRGEAVIDTSYLGSPRLSPDAPSEGPSLQ